MSGVLHGMVAAMNRDPFSGYITSLLRFNGSNGSTTITDSKLSVDWYCTGSAQLSTAQKKFGVSSLVVSSSTGYINAPTDNQSEFAYGTDNFTIEMWVYPTSLRDPYNFLVDSYGGGSTHPRIQLAYSSSTSATLALGNTGLGGAVVTVNNWHHIAVTRSGTTMRAFVNGSLQGSIGSSTNYTNYAGYPRLAAGWNTGDGFIGYIDDFRVTKGFARYTANFTPPGEL